MNAVDPTLLITREPIRVRVLFAGHEIADSDDVLVLQEPGRPLVRFFPRLDVAMVFLSKTLNKEYSSTLGTATFFTVYRDQKIVDNCAWSLEAPSPAAQELTDRIAFLSEHFDFEVEGHTVSETEALGFSRHSIG
ncbi:MAG: DUF427 domain-containing protein [Pseudomonadota bacterium]